MYYTLILICVSQEAVHKVCHSPGERGSEKVWQFVTGGGGVVKTMWRHTQFFHNSQFYFLFFIAWLSIFHLNLLDYLF